MTYKVILANSFVPVSRLLISAFVLTCALYTAKLWRRLCLLPVFIYFAVHSMYPGKTYFAFFDNLAMLWNHSVANYILYAISLIYIKQHALVAKRDLSCRNPVDFLLDLWYRIASGYKLWFNVRNIPARPPGPKPPLTTEDSRKSRHAEAISRYILFYVLALTKLALYYTIHIYLLPTLFDETVIEIQPQDVSPLQQTLLRRLRHVTGREVVVRTYMALYWIWQSTFVIDAAHTVCAMAFVASGLDDPDEWPPLFGYPVHAIGIRRFWSRFWHQIVVSTYRSYGEVVAQALRLKAGSWIYKTVISLVVFGISGAVHGVVAKLHGDLAWEWNIWWFLLNFLACFAETCIVAAVRMIAVWTGCTRELQVIANGWLGKCLGYAFVFLFFFWSVPKWRYPAEYQVAVRTEKLKRFFEGMSIIT